MTDTAQRLYVSRPQTVEAIQWTGGIGENYQAVKKLAGAKVRFKPPFTAPRLMLLAGKDGAQKWVPVPIGHWLVHMPGDLSDIWPVAPDYFEAKYQPKETDR